MNLYALFEARFSTDSTTILLTGEDGRSLSVGELVDATARYAAFLQSLGVQPGDRVAVQVEKSVEAVLLYLACLRAGAVYLPLNTAYRESEIAYFLSDATPKVVVHSPNDTEWLASIAASLNVRHRYSMPAAPLSDSQNVVEGRSDWDQNARKCSPMTGFVHREDRCGDFF